MLPKHEPASVAMLICMNCQNKYGLLCEILFSLPGSDSLPVQNFGGRTPKKILGAKNMQNLAQFRTTLKFGGEYLQNGWRYSKSDKYVFYRDSSRVRRNKSSEVWSSDLGDLDVELYPPKAHFLKDHISAHGVAGPPNFYTCHKMTKSC